jgi:aldose 1-epimerase
MGMGTFGEVDGVAVPEVTIRTKAGAEAKVIAWGAVVRDLVVPTASGGRQRVVLGLDRIEDYIAHSPHFGAIAGRYANRIAGGTFTLDGETWQLDRNQAGKHALHGGVAAFGKRLWQVAHHDESSVTLTLVSPDGDGGYPGAVTVTCVYRLLEPATLRVELTATTDAPTIVNLAQHSYFNLDGSASILDHELQLHADFYTPVDADLIPTGEILAVAGTAFDFRTPRPIRFPGAGGVPFHYDHNFVLTSPRPQEGELRPAATLRSSKSGVTLDVHTTEPGVQFYDGAKCSVPVPGHGGATYGANAGLCLEAQLWPNSPNNPHFTDASLWPGEVYRQVTEYRFS